MPRQPFHGQRTRHRILPCLLRRNPVHHQFAAKELLGRDDARLPIDFPETKPVHGFVERSAPLFEAVIGPIAQLQHPEGQRRVQLHQLHNLIDAGIRVGQQTADALNTCGVDGRRWPRRRTSAMVSAATGIPFAAEAAGEVRPCQYRFPFGTPGRKLSR